MSFKTLTGHEPYPHQIETYKTLARGKSVILRAERLVQDSMLNYGKGVNLI
jgi:hypothetical protein